MLRMNKDNSEYEIDRELTWKFAIEKNAEYQDRIAELEEENRKLKEKIKYIRKLNTYDYNELQDLVITLEEENKKLKSENEELKDAMKELNNYNKFRIQENDKLKSDLEECQCSMHFENDEVWYRKREYKRLKKWIKDHCKWYWNLFPEDEMKRQWKKANKKRK